MPRSSHEAKHIGGDEIFTLHFKFTIYMLLLLFRVDKGMKGAWISSSDTDNKPGQNFLYA